MNRGWAVDFGRRCGSNGNGDGRDFANFAHGVGTRIDRRKPPAALTARGELRTRPLSPSLCRMPTLLSSGFHPWLCGPSLIRRTAVCGPACTVVWEGRTGDCSPYPDWPVPSTLNRRIVRAGHAKFLLHSVLQISHLDPKIWEGFRAIALILKNRG